MKEEYTRVIHEYAELDHMELIDKKDLCQPTAVYLPHHAVVREDKITTKVRVVYDASCKGINGVSLNDNVMIGPRLQPTLRALIMKWRTYPVCLVADIVKMYRQVKVAREDTDYQRILWRDNPDEDIKEYRMLSHIWNSLRPLPRSKNLDTDCKRRR